MQEAPSAALALRSCFSSAGKRRPVKEFQWQGHSRARLTVFGTIRAPREGVKSVRVRQSTAKAEHRSMVAVAYVSPSRGPFYDRMPRKLVTDCREGKFW